MFSPLTEAQVSFTLGDEIGAEGKNSQTFKAHDPQLDADIVVKKIRKDRIADTEAYFNESRALYASAHPNVVQIHYACQDDEHVYVAMPLYQKGSVKALLTQRHLTVREIVSIGCQVLSGLHNVHSKGLVHFDIKSDNVLLSDRGEALISDFGLAKPLADGLATPDLIYDPNLPPEALVSTEFSAAYDIFQTGLTLYCMCVGVEAYKNQFLAYFDGEEFNGQRYAKDIAEGNYPDRRAFPPHIPGRLKNVIRKCLEIDPEDRYLSALEAMNDLAQVEGEQFDWFYVEAENGSRVWKKEKNGATYLFTVYSDSSCTMLKSVNGGKPKKQSAGTKASISSQEIARVLRTY